ncbi:RNA polymerase sigma factor [candidate division KSB1 bacterium]|nr:RNA polymerase sigma factor [candidate division KSB1 bacterium]
MDSEEKNLIMNAQAGQSTAFNQLVTRYDQQILQVIFGIMGNLADAQDVYQETFIKAYLKIQSFRFESEFCTWLTRIAINLCLNERRKKQIKRWLTFNPDDEMQNVNNLADFSNHGNPEHEYINHELNQLVQTAMKKLSSQQRAIFVLKHFQGYKIKEIAETLNCSEGTIKNQLFRAIQKLNKKLQPYF